MGLLIFWLIMAGVVAIIANNKGRSAGSWFLYGFLIWPIALVHIIVTRAEPTISEDRPFGGAPRSIGASDTRKCPFCAEIIKAEAIVCRYCNRDVAPVTGPPRRMVSGPLPDNGPPRPRATRSLPRDPGPPPAAQGWQRREPRF
jgi:hypothetical protein